MSLEAQIQELNTHLDKLNQLLPQVLAAYSPGGGTAETKAEPRAEKPTEEKPVEEKPVEQKAFDETALKKALTALVNAHGRAAMEEVLAQFGAAKFSELPVNQYDQIGAAVEAKIGG